MDPHNNETFADRKATDYWNQVDVYVGGTEHAVGHLLYSRLWTKVLYDLGLIGFDEPYKKLVNQGMITGSSRFLDKLIPSIDVKEGERGRFSPVQIMNSIMPFIYISKDVSEQRGKMHDEILKELNDKCLITSFGKENLIITDFAINENEYRVPIYCVDGVELNIEELVKWRNEFSAAYFIKNNSGRFMCGSEVEKMSKSKFNTENPDDIIVKYGADTFRMYEMFLGPVEQSKPWDTKGIEGVHRFLKKLWRLFFNEEKGKVWTDEKATPAELKVLHKTIKKIEEDTERFSFNTAVSAFMVCVNDLSDLKCNKKEILEPLLILLTPYAPHIAEELYHALGNTESVLNASYPKLENKYLTESEKEYPISINGKMRTTMVISLDATQEEVEKIVLNNDVVQKWIDGKTPKKIIYVRNRMVNVVI
jgi:leucyl-tRNA synthetase